MNLPAYIANRLRNLPIRQKLRLISGITAATALALAGIGMVVADTLLAYRHLRNDLATFAMVIGQNSAGALAFQDQKAANETLAALKARSHVQIACLVQSSGAVLATYVRPGFTGDCPAPGMEHIRDSGGILVASEPVALAGRQLGTLVLQYDLQEILERVGAYTGIMLAALLLSYLVTIAMSRSLRALVSAPILALANVAHAVTKSSDYSIRAQQASEDEIGQLAGAINTMLKVIESRDQTLREALAQQKAANDELATVNAELQRSNTDLERFAFMASHDLQEPLRMITTFSQLLVAKRDAGDHVQLEQFSEFITGGATRMRELLEDLLAYSEIAGSADRPPETVDLNVVVQEALALLRMRLEDTNGTVAVDDLPALEAHQNRIASLFQNLIENALKYHSDAPPHVSISMERGITEFTFSVADNGIGIPPEYHSKIFVAFQRLHGKEIPGTGIGLAICKRIVERYGGRIWVESDLGAGCTFRFTLPLSMATSRESAHGQHT